MEFEREGISVRTTAAPAKPLLIPQEVLLPLQQIAELRVLPFQVHGRFLPTTMNWQNGYLCAHLSAIGAPRAADLAKPVQGLRKGMG
jgi:hypothetical protein